jgi:hypothetical protein
MTGAAQQCGSRAVNPLDADVSDITMLRLAWPHDADGLADDVGLRDGAEQT